MGRCREVIIVDSYIRGLLYGDGYLQEEGLYIFTTTNVEVFSKVREYLDEKKVRYANYTRDYTDDKFNNWELLEIVEIRDVDFINGMDKKGFFSKSRGERILKEGGFLRGYLETKGTVIRYVEKGNVFWRVSFSGGLGDLEELRDILIRAGLVLGSIHRRREREDRGVISKSFRLSINNRGSIRGLLDYIYKEGDEVSGYLKGKILEFIDYDMRMPFNNKKKVYKHYKGASLSMARQFGYEIKGVRGGKFSGSGAKPVYRWEGNKKIEEFAGWVGVYEELSKRYEEIYGIEAPKVVRG